MSEGIYALHATRQETVRAIVLKKAISGILTIKATQSLVIRCRREPAEVKRVAALTASDNYRQGSDDKDH